MDKGRIWSPLFCSHHPQQVGELALPFSTAAEEGEQASPHLGSTAELTGMAGVQMNKSPGCEHVRAGPAACSILGPGRDALPTLAPHGRGRAGPGVMRAGELALPLTRVSPWESGPWIWRLQVSQY